MMRESNDNDHIFLHYIDGNMEAAEADALKKSLDDESEYKEELFASKHIADLVRFGRMPLRDQERGMLELLTRAKASDKKVRILSVIKKVAMYASVFVFAFIAGVMTLDTLRNDQGKVVVQASSGNKSDVILPDGTNVTLKSSSVLIYDILEFNSCQRKVFLNGEAFFDVVHDPDRKFIVQTRRQNVIVHGTTFNMRAFEKDRNNIITLLEGNVTTDIYSEEQEKIRSIDMHSMERCICNLQSGETILENVDPSELNYEWDKNLCHLKNKTLWEVADIISLYYDTEIHIHESVKGDDRYTGTISLNAPISDVLKLINYDGRYNITKEDDTYTINNNNHN